MPRQVVPPSKFPLLKRHAISRWRQAIVLLTWHHVLVLAEMFVLPLALLSSVFLSHSWGGFGSCTSQMQSSRLFSSRGMWGLCKKLSGRGSAFCLALLCFPKNCSSPSLRVPSSDPQTSVRNSAARGGGLERKQLTWGTQRALLVPVSAPFLMYKQLLGHLMNLSSYILEAQQHHALL